MATVLFAIPLPDEGETRRHIRSLAVYLFTPKPPTLTVERLLLLYYWEALPDKSVYLYRESADPISTAESFRVKDVRKLIGFRVDVPRHTLRV